MTDDELELTELDEGNPRLDVEERDDDEGGMLEVLEDWLLGIEPTATDLLIRLLNKLGPATLSSML